MLIYQAPTHYNLTNLKVTTGDKLRFEVKHNGEHGDSILWNPEMVINQVTSP